MADADVRTSSGANALSEAQQAATAVEKTLENLARLNRRHKENLILQQHGQRRVAMLSRGAAHAQKMAGLYENLSRNYEYTASISDAQSTRSRWISGAHGAVACGKLAEILLVCSKFTGAMDSLSKKAKASVETLETVKTGLDIAKEGSEAVRAGSKGDAGETALKSSTTLMKFFDLGRELADIVDALMAWVGLIPPPKGKSTVSGADLVAAFGKSLKALYLFIKNAQFASFMAKSGISVRDMGAGRELFNSTKTAKMWSQGADAMGAIANVAEAIIACYKAYEEFQLANAFAEATQSDLGTASRHWGGAMGQADVSVLRACLASKEHEIRFDYFQRIISNRGTALELNRRLNNELKQLLPRLRMANTELPIFASQVAALTAQLRHQLVVLSMSLQGTQDAWMVADKAMRGRISTGQVGLEKTLARGYAALE